MIRKPHWPLAALALIAPGIALAIPTAPDGLEDASLEQLVEMIDAEDDDAPDVQCRIRVPVFAELKRRQPANAEVARLLAISSVFCADERGDERKALALLRDYEQQFSEGSEVAAYGLYLATATEDAAEVEQRLRRIAATNDPAQFASLDPELVFFGIRALRDDKGDAAFEDLALEFATADAFPSLHDDLRNSFARSAIGAALRGGGTELATGLLGEATNPSSFVTLLASRDYEAIWPQIEVRVGEHYRAVTGPYADRSLAAYRRDTKDSDLFSAAAHALHYDGRWDEVIALARELPRTDESFDALVEGQGWALNLEAYALDALGRRAEADAVFDRLASLPADEKPWLVNYVINRASRLVGQGRWAEGLGAAQRAAEVAERHGSTYAKMLIARDRVCALNNLGRGAEATPHLAYMTDNSKDAPSVHVQALMCAGRRGEAAKAAVRALEEERTRAVMIEELQPVEMDLFYTRSILPQPHELIASDAAVRRAFLTYARMVPEQFYPAASLKR